MEWTTTDDVSAEIWRRLLEYANDDFSLSELTKIHGLPKDDSQRENYKKQVTQLRGAIIQAREYYAAAHTATIATSPNHLYYGTVALATAVMLLLGTGEFSLDRLRQKKKNQGHGLMFSTNATAKDCTNELLLLEQTHVEVARDGHFLNWYSCIPDRQIIYANVATYHPGNIIGLAPNAVGRAPIPKVEDIIGRKWQLLDLLKVLPDLRADLIRYGIPVNSTRGSYGISSHQDDSRTHQWIFHPACSTEFAEKILTEFRTPANSSIAIQIQKDPSGLSSIVTIKLPKNQINENFEYPAVRQTLAHEQIWFSPDPSTPEFSDAYIASFALSMLCRYYPDIWTTCVASHGKTAKLVELFVTRMIKKIPLLALEALNRRPIIISTQLPTWTRIN